MYYRHIFDMWFFFFLHEEKVVLHMFQIIINFFVIKTNPFSHSNQKVIYI